MIETQGDNLKEFLGNILKGFQMISEWPDVDGQHHHLLCDTAVGRLEILASQAPGGVWHLHQCRRDINEEWGPIWRVLNGMTDHWVPPPNKRQRQRAYQEAAPIEPPLWGEKR